MGDWISVKERLPPFNQRILVCSGKWIDIAQYFEHSQYQQPNAFYCAVSGNLLPEITHWMSIPKPPEDGA